ncbi:N-acetylneuraminate synthase family protein [bacterium]|nr:N-acetylneuraminate synthase family protein [bacterium]MBU1752874.1 N-acetylneuraminate synthase family protein [bacterium]
MPLPQIALGNKIIGENAPIFIIAEAGVNHNGSLERAKQMIEAAKEAGCDAVKFQSFTAKNLLSNAVPQGVFQMLRELELSREAHLMLSEYAEETGISFLSTPFDEEQADMLEEMGMPAFKIPSGELTNHPLLKHIAKKKKPVLLSCGMANIEEIAESIEIILRENPKLILLQCTTSYPCSPEDANLRVIQSLYYAFGLLVGYSDHTLGTTAAVIAATLGARVIEKHFTLSTALPGPDHKASIELAQLKKLVQKIREAEQCLGKPQKFPALSEITARQQVRKGITAKRDIAQGEVITPEIICMKRPAIGILPAHIDLIVGRKARVNIAENEPIGWDKIDG